MLKKTAALGLAALMLTGGAAFASDAYTGTYNDPNSNFRYNEFPGVANYCPAGLQPVQIGGEICCGIPNAGPYVDRAGGHRTVRASTYHAGVKGMDYSSEGIKGMGGQ
ncbi:hypothetical protein SAMN05421759_11846 [Roseivivax lentus]|uniref:Porin n=1 Tax=Roseivivax lentus TaxID=633194 RepID=A0A1N7PPV6_9RHOB|nr:hypothetical protein [Roseivivax lentus]SIT12565.1 hypothetical protein SAMN05421759_11846 [Roseivivax lentus]